MTDVTALSYNLRLSLVKSEQCRTVKEQSYAFISREQPLSDRLSLYDDDEASVREGETRNDRPFVFI